MPDSLRFFGIHLVFHAPQDGALLTGQQRSSAQQSLCSMCMCSMHMRMHVVHVDPAALLNPRSSADADHRLLAGGASGASARRWHTRCWHRHADPAGPK